VVTLDAAAVDACVLFACQSPSLLLNNSIYFFSPS
jgi:hypothetical protein